MKEDISLALSIVSLLVSLLSWSQMKQSNLFYQKQAEAAIAERTPYLTINHQNSYGSKQYGIYVTNSSSSVAIIEKIKINGEDYDYVTSSMWEKILQEQANLDKDIINLCFGLSEPYKNAGLPANNTMPLIFIRSFLLSDDMIKSPIFSICKKSLEKLNKLDIRFSYKSSLPNAEIQVTPEMTHMLYAQSSDTELQPTPEMIKKFLRILNE